jgi:hypothetical protein
MYDYTGAQQALNNWLNCHRVEYRSEEIQAIFEWNRIECFPRSFLKTPSLGVTDIIPSGSIKAYFDFLPFKSGAAANIGKYLKLTEGDIYVGSNVNNYADEITFVNVNPTQSIIELGM